MDNISRPTDIVKARFGTSVLVSICRLQSLDFQTWNEAETQSEWQKLDLKKPRIGWLELKTWKFGEWLKTWNIGVFPREKSELVMPRVTHTLPRKRCCTKASCISSEGWSRKNRIVVRGTNKTRICVSLQTDCLNQIVQQPPSKHQTNIIIQLLK